MGVLMRRMMLAGGSATVVVAAGLTAVGQTYFHAPAGGPPDYTTWGSRTSFYTTSHGAGYAPYLSPYPPSYQVPFGMAPSSFAPTYPAAGVMPYGASYSNPRGRLSYDVNTPYGTMEHNYRFRRNGTVTLDIDD